MKGSRLKSNDATVHVLQRYARAITFITDSSVDSDPLILETVKKMIKDQFFYQARKLSKQSVMWHKGNYKWTFTKCVYENKNIVTKYILKKK